MVPEPLIRDRIAIARPAKEEPGMLTDIAGLRSPRKRGSYEIKSGTFPSRLKPGDWQSGSINWLLDVIAPDPKTAGQVVASFRQVAKEGELRLHPHIVALLDKDMLDRMRALSTLKGH